MPVENTSTTAMNNISPPAPVPTPIPSSPAVTTLDQWTKPPAPVTNSHLTKTSATMPSESSSYQPSSSGSSSTSSSQSTKRRITPTLVTSDCDKKRRITPIQVQPSPQKP
ncbi:unnamed protein product [Absidia cylindrospora]